MFAVLAGTADVSRDGEHIRTLAAGDVFGEIAVLFGGQRTATVKATSPMRLVMLFNGELARDSIATFPSSPTRFGRSSPSGSSATAARARGPTAPRGRRARSVRGPYEP